jgi:hypothetical protein
MKPLRGAETIWKKKPIDGAQGSENVGLISYFIVKKRDFRNLSFPSLHLWRENKLVATVKNIFPLFNNKPSKAFTLTDSIINFMAKLFPNQNKTLNLIFI